MAASSAAPGREHEIRWYTEHTALVITTLKWALLGVVAGLCVGLGTRAFLWTLAATTAVIEGLASHGLRPYDGLPLALPIGVWLTRRFAPTARGHGTEAVIAAVHQESGRIDWRVAPVKLASTILTLAFGGSVGKEGPCAQIGSAITSLFADCLRLTDEDRRRLVICGIGAGFAAVFGTPLSGALFGIEVLYLGRIEYAVLFPCLMAGIIAHLVSGVAPRVAALPGGIAALGQTNLVIMSIAFGAVCGLVALLLIETMRAMEHRLRPRAARHPYATAAVGGVVLAALFRIVGDAYAGLGSATIDAALAGDATSIGLAAPLVKIGATALTLEVGGSGGIVTPLFFIGSTTGVAFAHLLHLPVGLFAVFGFVAVLAAAANTPIAAAVMGMELLPGQMGVYAALAAAAAFLMVGHRSVYASQRLGLVKSAGLEVVLDVPVGEIHRAGLRIRKNSLTDRTLRLQRRLQPTSLLRRRRLR
jgi:H+/Cl- antiporter ClcA